MPGNFEAVPDAGDPSAKTVIGWEICHGDGARRTPASHAPTPDRAPGLWGICVNRGDRLGRLEQLAGNLDWDALALFFVKLDRYLVDALVIAESFG